MCANRDVRLVVPRESSGFVFESLVSRDISIRDTRSFCFSFFFIPGFSQKGDNEFFAKRKLRFFKDRRNRRGGVVVGIPGDYHWTIVWVFVKLFDRQLVFSFGPYCLSLIRNICDDFPGFWAARLRIFCWGWSGSVRGTGKYIREVNFKIINKGWRGFRGETRFRVWRGENRKEKNEFGESQIFW